MLSKFLQNNLGNLLGFFGIFLALQLFTGKTFAQTDSVYWSFGTSGSATKFAGSSTNANVLASACASDTGNVNSTGLGSSVYSPIFLTNQASSTGTGTYTGASGEPTIRNNAKTGSFNASASSYLAFTVTPNSGYTLEIKSISFGGQRTATGPTSYTIRTSADGYATNVATGTLTSNTYGGAKKSHTNLSITGTAGTPITVRIYTSGAAGTATSGNVFMDDVTVSFNITGGVTTTTWNGTTWDNGAPTSTVDAVIASSTTPGSFTCKGLTINNGVALTLNGATATINGNLTNSGNGISGTGTVTFASSGAISGNAISIAGVLTVASGATLTTNGLLTLSSDATNTGSIGNSAGTISGNVTIQRYIPALRAFRFLAHPFTTSQALTALTDDIDITGNGGSTNGFTTTNSNNPSCFWYDPATGDGSTVNDAGWTAFTNTNGSGGNAWGQYQGIRTLVRGSIGQGLNGSAYTPNAVTLDMAGTVNQGNQVITVTKGSGTTYFFTGNPYPSQVDMSLTTRGSNIGSSYYIWDATQGTKGAYVAKLFSASYILPSFAGFIAVTSANTSNTITFHEADKSTSAAGSIFKTTAFSENIKLSLHSNNDSISWDAVQLYFDKTTVADSEWNDAAKLYNPEISFYSLSNDSKPLAIDVRPYTNGETILLGLAYASQKTYTLKADEVNMPAGTFLYLHDKYLNKTEAVTQGYTYDFSITADSLSQGNNRFELQTTGDPLNINNAEKNRQLQVSISPNPASEVVKIHYKSGSKDHISAVLKDITGKTLHAVKQTASNAEGDILLPVSTLPAGLYIVEVNAGNESVKQKMIKQ